VNYTFNIVFIQSSALNSSSVESVDSDWLSVFLSFIISEKRFEVFIFVFIILAVRLDFPILIATTRRIFKMLYLVIINFRRCEQALKSLFIFWVHVADSP